jgi:hypothetical protein
MNPEVSGDSITPVARAALSQRSPRVECPTYFKALEKALREEPPPFGMKAYSDIYRRASEDAKWMAISLITAAEREGDGAKRLWSLAACSVNEEEQRLLKRHAVDESKHALLYLALLDLSFPNAVESSFHSELRKLSPGYTIEQPLFAVEGSPYSRAPSVDDFLQMNIAEIRTTIHQAMQRQALNKHCPANNLPRLTRILDSLRRDELSHVAYTAVLIERKAYGVEQSRVSNLFCKRFRDFNDITTQELGDKIFE